MLLAVDIGNTQTVLGLFELKESSAPNLASRNSFRIATNKEATTEQVAVTLNGLLQLSDRRFNDIKAVVLSSVVPSLTSVYEKLSSDYLKVKPLAVDSGLNIGMTIAYSIPSEVGPDRLANGVAVKNLYGFPAIVVDFGTATTFDVVDKDGQYIGGAIAPGIEVSVNALIEKASRLSHVELVSPKKAIGDTTSQSINSGVIYGFAGQVDRLNKLISKEIGPSKPTVIATGGLLELITPHCTTIDKTDPLLTLKGLKIIYDLNRK